MFLLESEYGAKVHQAHSVEEAILIVKRTSPEIDLIIVDPSKVPEARANKFYNVSIGIPILVYGEDNRVKIPSFGKVVGTISRSSFMDGVTGSLDDLILREIIEKGALDPDYVRIKTKLLLSVCPLQGDIFFKLNDNKYIKLFNEGDSFEFKDLEKYTLQKGIQYLYISKEDCKEFAEKFREEMKQLLEATKTITFEEVSKMGSSVQDTVRELNKKLGFTREVQEMARTYVKLAIKSIGAHPELEQMLSKIKRDSESYLHSHTMICAYLACAISSLMQWGSETTFFKLVLAAFFHDITLENSALAAIDSLVELENSKTSFTPEEVKAFREHPISAAELISTMAKIPQDVATIIREHHEKPDGSGFPRGVNHTYISPLSSIFIVAHDLTRYALLNKSDFRIIDFSKEFREKYRSGHFKKIMQCFPSDSTPIRK